MFFFSFTLYDPSPNHRSIWGFFFDLSGLIFGPWAKQISTSTSNSSKNGILSQLELSGGQKSHPNMSKNKKPNFVQRYVWARDRREFVWRGKSRTLRGKNNEQQIMFDDKFEIESLPSFFRNFLIKNRSVIFYSPSPCRQLVWPEYVADGGQTGGRGADGARWLGRWGRGEEV